MEEAKDCEALLDLEEKVQRARKGEALEELLPALLASSCLEKADARLWARAFERAGRRDLIFRFLRGCLESGQGCRGVEDVIRGLGTTREGRAFLAEVARALADKGFLENTSPPYWASVLFQQAPEVLTARMPGLLKRILREGEEPNASYARYLSTVLEHRPTPRGEAPLWLEAIRRFPAPLDLEGVPWRLVTQHPDLLPEVAAVPGLHFPPPGGIPTEHLLEAAPRNPNLAAACLPFVDPEALYLRIRDKAHTDPDWWQEFSRYARPRGGEALADFLAVFLSREEPEALGPILAVEALALDLPEDLKRKAARAVPEEPVLLGSDGVEKALVRLAGLGLAEKLWRSPAWVERIGDLLVSRAEQVGLKAALDDPLLQAAAQSAPREVAARWARPPGAGEAP